MGMGSIPGSSSFICYCGKIGAGSLHLRPGAFQEPVKRHFFTDPEHPSINRLEKPSEYSFNFISCVDVFIFHQDLR